MNDSEALLNEQCTWQDSVSEDDHVAVIEEAEDRMEGKCLDCGNERIVPYRAFDLFGGLTTVNGPCPGCCGHIDEDVFKAIWG